MEKYDDTIEQWIASKSFNQLSKQQQKKVLLVMTEDDYMLQRSIILESNAQLAQEARFIQPDPAIKANLLAAVNKRKASNNWIIYFMNWLFNFQMPVYQTALVLLLLLGAYSLFQSNKSPATIIKEKIVYQTKTDTVVYTETIKVEVPVKVIERVEVPVQALAAEQSVKQNENSTLETAMWTAENGQEENLYAFSDADIAESKNKSMGNSSIENSALEQFLVASN